MVFTVSPMAVMIWSSWAHRADDGVAGMDADADAQWFFQIGLDLIIKLIEAREHIARAAKCLLCTNCGLLRIETIKSPLARRR